MSLLAWSISAVVIISVGLRACKRNFYIHSAARSIHCEVFLQGKTLKCMYALLRCSVSDCPFEVHLNIYICTTIFIATIFRITILFGLFVFWRETFLTGNT